ncbi:MAG TPA: hypothetical protein VNO30_32705 [Kofleriaceae bacterium]|nr:hypothetical protein [Kofleriaceae bacterium]
MIIPRTTRVPGAVGSTAFIGGSVDAVVAIADEGKVKCLLPLSARSSETISYRTRKDSYSDGDAKAAVAENFQHQVDQALIQIYEKVVGRR